MAFALTLLLAQTAGRAAAGDAINTLPYSKGFLVNGNYVVGGVDLTEEIHPIVDGFSTGTIQMGDLVPANAEVVAAYLFWETITLSDDPATPDVDESLAQLAGIKFRGFDIDAADAWTVKRSVEPLQGSTATCWSSGVPLVMNMLRADVLRFLPMQLDKDDYPTGRFLVNDSDLVAQGFDPHTVKLPVQTGNQIPESAGASLFVVYRDPSEPLRKIVLYDGIHIQTGVSEVTEQTLQGIYRSAIDTSAKLTHIAASGQPNGFEKMLFNGTEIQSDPFNSPGSASQRGWGNPTHNVSALMTPGSNSGVYGETATTSVSHQPPNGGYDCITWGAIALSTAVADIDHDGLPDGLEDAAAGLKDPDGKDLPNLKAMGADSNLRDIFIEVNAMRAGPGTSYGSADAPFDSTADTVTDTEGHHHVPTPEVLKMVGDAYAARQIRVHFDVGDVAAYHALGVVEHSDWVDDYTSTAAEQYLVGNGAGTNAPGLARGGEIITETGCNPDSPFCHFPDYPGTVLWKIGVQAHRDALVRDDGTELTLEQLTDPEVEGYFDWNAGAKRRRLDPARKGLFRYMLYAHARATPKSLPCLEDGHPAPYDVETEEGQSCLEAVNPDFKPLEYHVPSSASGIADLPGDTALITLGLWDEFVARPFARAGTTFHELGHNLELWHGGLPAILGSKQLDTATYMEPNCKPNHLSSMSYLFQVHGLFDNSDQIHLDYSTADHGDIDEGMTVADTPLFPSPAYQPAWFAPFTSPLAVALGVSPATRFCSGERFDSSAPSGSLKNPFPMARVHAASTTDPIDWDGDPATSGVPSPAMPFQDVNFDGILSSASTVLNGADDWAKIRLDAIGAAPIGAMPGSLEGLDDAVLIFHDGGLLGHRGGVFDGSGLLGGRGGLLGGRGGDWHEGGLLGGRGGLLGGRGGLLGGRGGLLGGRGGQEEINLTFANDLGKTRPYKLNGCIIGVDAECSGLATEPPPFDPLYHRVVVRFTAPPFGDFSALGYEVQRKRAAASDDAFVTVGTTFTNLFIDPTELANGVQYGYRLRGLSATGNTGWSRTLVVTAVNDAPVASPDSYQMTSKQTLKVAAPGVLGNDQDHDSPTAFRGRRVQLLIGPTSGTLVLNADGSFTFQPVNNGFVGVVTFTYRADDGLSSDSPTVPLSDWSLPTTVTITVVRR